MTKQTNKHLTTVGVYSFLLLATCILLYQVIFTKEVSFHIIGDNLHQSYPFLNKLCIALHKGYLPTWDANTFGGKNFTGEFQSGTFYPLNILWCLLFGSAAGIHVYYIDLLVALHYFISLTGMYNVARVLKMPPAPAIASALTFTFTGILSARSGCETNIFYGLALLPWAVYFTLSYYWRQRSKRYFIFSGLVTGLQILAGHIQPFFHTMLIISLIILAYEYNNRKNWASFSLSLLINITIILFIALILALPQVYYAAEYMARCYREVGQDGTYIGPSQKVPFYVFGYRLILQPADFENLIGQKSVLLNDFNFLYMGILPLFLCISFLIKNKYLNLTKEHLFLKKILLIILIIGVLSVLGYLTFFSYLLYAIPLVNEIRELSRYVILISFSGALLVGLSLTYLEDLASQFTQLPNSRKYGLLALSAIAIYWILFQQENIPLNISIPFLLGFIFFWILSNIKPGFYVQILAIFFIMWDLSLNPVNASSAKSIFYADSFYSRNKIVDFLETTYGKYRTTIDMNVWALTRRNIGDLYNIQTKYGYCATVNQGYYDFIHSGRDSVIDDLLNVKYIITDKFLDSSSIFKDSAQGMKLYERRTCYPRCYWKHQLDQRRVDIEADNKLNIQQLSYSDLYQKWAVHCLSSDTLIFSENIYPGWKCIDNNREIPIFSAKIKDYPPLFRMVRLDKGTHIIEFKYNKVFHWF